MTSAERELLLMVGTQLAITATQSGHEAEGRLFRDMIDLVLHETDAPIPVDGPYARFIRLLASQLEELIQRPN